MRMHLWLMLLAVVLTAELRFHDGQMMRKHHNHEGQVNGPIKVFLMPHSHDDVGWLKTVDDYFYGGDQNTQWAGVQYTIDTVVTELAQNPTYKFSIVEMAFLYRWWNNANQTQRELIKKHIENKQLELVNAGWCMSDEAAPYYEDIIDQMTVGFRWAKDTFGVVPTIGWHIDPFGHQSSNAAIFSQLGFNAWFFARIDYQDKAVRLSNKAMEMIWHPTQYSTNDNYIFTHVNYYHYSPPPGFCFDNNCRDDPIKDDPTLDGYNVDIKSQALVNYFKNQSLHFKSSNLFHTLGQDFHYANARMWYKNVDKLIKYINARPEFGVTIQYATPSQYIKAVNEEGLTFPTKYDDFFPYADRPHGFWTGYFVSRTALKSFIRELGRYVQAVRTQIALLKIAGTSDYVKNNGQAIEKAIWEAETALGVLQHHDAVAGTAKQRVTNNYVYLGSKALALLNKQYNEIRKEQIKNDIGETVVEINTNTTWNETAVEWGVSAVLDANKSVLLQMYNPGPKGTYQVYIKVDERAMNIVSSNGSTINGDLICSNTKNTKDCELIFNVAFEEASTAYVKLVPVKSGGSAKAIKLQDITLLDSSKQFNISSTTVLKYTRATQKFDLNTSGKTMAFQINYDYYESYQGDGQKSGAYIFRPANETISTPKKYSTLKSVHYAEGDIVTVVVLQGDKTYSKMYFNKQPSYVENNGFMLQTFVDTISVSDKVGKEIVLTIPTTFTNNKTFYTDSNGLEELKRILDYRPTWQFINDEPASGNYYPINSHISLIDETTKQRLSVLVDRSQGGAVIREGNIEIMIQRRTTMDDARGVGEPLDQSVNGVGLTQKMRHYIVLGDNNRAVQKANDQRIIISWANTNLTTFSKNPTPKPVFTVPSTVKLHLRPFTDGSYLLRLTNFDTSKSTMVNIPNGWSIEEYALGFNQLLSDMKKNKYTWKETKYEYDTGDQPRFGNHSFHVYGNVKEGTVDLKPFEIRTFKLTKNA